MIKHSLLTRIRLELLRRIKYAIFMQSGSPRAKRFVKSVLPDEHTLFVVVGFNDARLLQLQLKLLAAHSIRPFVYLIVDNSNDREESEKIRSFADSESIPYMKLPKNWYSNSRGAAKIGRGSLSHSVALDWTWRKIIVPLRPKIAVLLDHDVFPLVDFDSEKILGTHLAAGPPRFGAERWSLWPGLTFFDFGAVSDYRISFMPSGDLDSGAGLWHTWLRHFDASEFHQMSRRQVEITQGTHPAKDELEIIGDSWLHLGDGSGWLDGIGKADALIALYKAKAALPPEVATFAELLLETGSQEQQQRSSRP